MWDPSKNQVKPLISNHKFNLRGVPIGADSQIHSRQRRPEAEGPQSTAYEVSLPHAHVRSRQTDRSWLAGTISVIGIEGCAAPQQTWVDLERPPLRGLGPNAARLLRPIHTLDGTSAPLADGVEADRQFPTHRGRSIPSEPSGRVGWETTPARRR